MGKKDYTKRILSLLPNLVSGQGNQKKSNMSDSTMVGDNPWKTRV